MAPDNTPELQQRVRELERNNAQLKQAIRQGDHIRRQWQTATRELKSAKAELSSSRRFLEQVIEDTPDPLLVCASNGKIELANRSLIELVGKSAAELKSLRPLRLIDASRRHEVLAAASILFQNPGRMTLDIPVISVSGEVRLLSTVWNCLHTKDNRLERVIIIGRDITVQKQTEDALVEAREQALANAHAKSLFLANISHELRTPLNAILGMTELLEEYALESNQRRYLSHIEQAGHNLLLLINDALDFSKVDSGKLKLETTSFDVRELLEELNIAYTPLVNDKGIRLKIDIPQTLHERYLGDAGRISQVVNKLLANAIKFTDKGSVRIAVATHARIGDESWLRFEVSDTGKGISAEDQDCIFDSFTQVDIATTREHSGTGLGLALARQLA